MTAMATEDDLTSYIIINAHVESEFCAGDPEPCTIESEFKFFFKTQLQTPNDASLVIDVPAGVYFDDLLPNAHHLSLICYSGCDSLAVNA